jgi:hypothetical protein
MVFLNFHNMQNLSDKALYKLCKEYGKNALVWRRKFMGLLPEVNRRRLYEKKSFSSIFEFAKKLCGLSEEQVRRVLNLEERFQDKPVLHKALVSGEVSVNKLSRVAAIATPENESFWAEKAGQLSKSALETLVRDENGSKDGLFKTQDEAESVPGHRLELDADVEEELLELQGKGIYVNGLLREFLEKRKRELAEEKSVLAAEVGVARAGSRYIPARIRRHLQKEHGKVCSINGCRKPTREIHHMQRFALGRNHDPRYLAPLCKEHHQIAHAIDVQVQVRRGT